MSSIDPDTPATQPESSIKKRFFQQALRLLFLSCLFGVLIMAAAPQGWVVTIGAILLGISAMLVAVWGGPRVQRAFYYQLYFAFSIGGLAVLFWAWAVLDTLQVFPGEKWIVLGFALLATTIGSLWEYHDIRRRFERMRQHNENKGCFDVVNGFWYPDVGLDLTASVVPGRQEIDWLALVPWVIALAPALGQLAARSGWRGMMFANIILLVVAPICTLLTAYTLGIATDIAKLERELGKPLLVSLKHINRIRA